jgi:hypothetical protein
MLQRLVCGENRGPRVGEGAQKQPLSTLLYTEGFPGKLPVSRLPARESTHDVLGNCNLGRPFVSRRPRFDDFRSGPDRFPRSETPPGPINEIRRQINADYAKIVAEHPGLSDEADELMLGEITRLTEPTFAQIDLLLYRPFELSEQGQGEIFFQVFNLLNRENVGLIEGRVSSANFGRAITLAGPPRTVELGVRFAF